MNKNIMKLPIMTSIGGFVYRLAFLAYISFMITRNADLSANTFFLDLALTLLIIFLIGILVRKIYSREELIRSINLLVAYSLAIHFISLLIRKMGFIAINFHLIAFLPVEIFNLGSSIMRNFIMEKSSFVRYIPIIIDIFIPYVFLIFVKRDKA